MIACTRFFFFWAKNSTVMYILLVVLTLFHSQFYPLLSQTGKLGKDESTGPHHQFIIIMCMDEK